MQRGARARITLALSEIEEPRDQQNADGDEHGSDGDTQDPQGHLYVHADKCSPPFGRLKGNVRGSSEEDALASRNLRRTNSIPAKLRDARSCSASATCAADNDIVRLSWNRPTVFRLSIRSAFFY